MYKPPLTLPTKSATTSNINESTRMELIKNPISAGPINSTAKLAHGHPHRLMYLLFKRGEFCKWLRHIPNDHIETQKWVRHIINDITNEVNSGLYTDTPVPLSEISDTSLTPSSLPNERDTEDPGDKHLESTDGTIRVVIHKLVEYAKHQKEEESRSNNQTLRSCLKKPSNVDNSQQRKNIDNHPHRPSLQRSAKAQLFSK